MKKGYLEKFWNGVRLEEEEREDLEIRGCWKQDRITLIPWNLQTGKNKNMEKKNKIKTLDSEIRNNMYTLYIKNKLIINYSDNKNT